MAVKLQRRTATVRRRKTSRDTRRCFGAVATGGVDPSLLSGSSAETEAVISPPPPPPPLATLSSYDLCDKRVGGRGMERGKREGGKEKKG